MRKIIVDQHREFLPVSVLKDTIHAVRNPEDESIIISIELHDAIMSAFEEYEQQKKKSPTQMSLFK